MADERGQVTTRVVGDGGRMQSVWAEGGGGGGKSLRRAGTAVASQDRQDHEWQPTDADTTVAYGAGRSQWRLTLLQSPPMVNPPFSSLGQSTFHLPSASRQPASPPNA